MTCTRLFRLYSAALSIVLALTTSVNLSAETITLEDDNSAHITFKKITPNHFDINENTVSIKVDSSASFILLAFDDIKKVNTISFKWQKHGAINIKSIQQEETRKGDDAYLRIGLIIKGHDPLPNPLAPKWIKKVRATLHHSSDKMICIVPGSKHKEGQHWASPYNDKVENIAVGSTMETDGWNYSEYTFENTQPVVGLWIMADGDNTQSAFTSYLKALTLN